MTTGLRIGIASSGLGHVARGIEAWASDLARALWDRGIDARLYKGGGVAADPREVVVPCWQREGRTARTLVKFRRFGWRFGFGSTYNIEQLRFSRNLLPRLKADRIDVLHVQDPAVARYLEDQRQKGRLATRTILGHGTEESLEYLARFEYLQHLAPWHLEQAREAGVYRPTWTAIPNFLDTERFRPGPSEAIRRELGIPADGQVVLTSAAIRRFHKRIDYLISEFADLLGRWPSDRPRPYLVVAGGRESDTDELVAEGQARLGDRVRFLVRYPRERMAELYRAADVFVLCSLLEMMPIALLEATSTGLPCLVHEHPVLTWMTGSGGDARDLSRSGTLSAGLSSLLNDPARRLELGQAARTHCLANFGRDAVVDRILAYYKQVGGHEVVAAK